MNVPPSEAKALSYYEYHQLLHNWNKGEGGDDIKAPDAATTQRILDKIAADPRLTKAA